MDTDLSPYVTLLPMALILVVAIWLSRRLNFGRQLVSALVIAFVSFQMLFFLQGYAGIPDDQATEIERILFTIALIFSFNAVMQLLQSIFYEVVLRRRTVKLPNFIISVFGWVATFVIAIVVIRQVLGIELTGLIVTSTIVSAIIALSFQEILSGLFAGLVMQVEAPFSIGDWVEVAGQEGTIERLNWRTVAILTRSNNYVIFTNNDVASTKIINYSRPQRNQAIQARITVAALHPPGRVKETLLRVLAGVDGVLAAPGPLALVTGYEKNDIHYLINFWIVDFGPKNLILDEVYSRFWYTLDRAGMGAPFSMLDVNVRSPDEDAHVEATQQRVESFLRSLPMLSNWNEAQIELLAAAVILKYYTSGEMLVRQGDEGDSLFLVYAGQAGVYVDHETNRVRVATRDVGEFFGEMSLLTGEPRSATVVAESEMEVVVIDKSHFVSILTTDPAILELLVDALEARQLETAEQIAAAKAQQPDVISVHANLMDRIARFLGITI